MRIVTAALAASLTLAFSPLALGLENVPKESLGPGLPDKPAPTRAARLDELFASLKAAPDEGAAKGAENGIIALWLESGSDTIDLLMSWSLKAIEDKDYPLALDLLDRVVTMKPDYAEGWNKRATVFYLTEDYGQSISDIRRALTIEPRHFGALSGLGSILHEIGDDKKAVDAYNQALALDPYLDNVKKALGEIHKDTDGKDI
jgi:tetratricopeptide (TPR) repeat protein